MAFEQYPRTILRELEGALARLDPVECETAVGMVDSAQRVFTLGLGRLGFVLRCLAMRLMHSGRTAYVVGETITPSFGPGDLLIVGSASGETKQLTDIAEKAKRLGGNVLALTAAGDSLIVGIADSAIVIAASSKEREVSANVSVQPMASLFEQCVLLFGDSMVLALMARSPAKDTASMFANHANLE